MPLRRSAPPSPGRAPRSRNAAVLPWLAPYYAGLPEDSADQRVLRIRPSLHELEMVQLLELHRLLQPAGALERRGEFARLAAEFVGIVLGVGDDHRTLDSLRLEPGTVLTHL